MREFIGHKIKLVAQEIGAVEGTVVDDTGVFLFVKGEDNKITRVIKQKICGFTPLDFEPKDYIPFHVLYCDNKKTGCPGVKFIQEGDGFKPTDFEIFMGDCPCRSAECGYGTKGEIHSIAGSILRDTIANSIFGEFPEKEKEDQGGTGSTGDGDKTERPAADSAGDEPDEESSDG